MLSKKADWIWLCLFLVMTVDINGESVVVTTPYGDLRGTRTSLHGGTHVDTFFNVPFARPPVGNLRFRQPQEPIRWIGVRDATTFGAKCMQEFSPLDAIQFPVSEDCLYLNVYSPVGSRPGSLLPVMVWIFGGSFLSGTGNGYNGFQLATKGVVVVTINYRLGAFGFLSTEDAENPGNYGLWDQIKALEWVRDSISAFRGDPYDVTIFGQSAGSASVSLLIQSTMARGLFQKAIMQSGTSLSPFAVGYPNMPPIPRVQTILLATELGCSSTSGSSRMVECLRTKAPDAILNASTVIQMAAGTVIFRPVPETTFNEHGILPATPSVTWENGWFSNVSTLRGYNRNEGAFDFDPEDDGITLSEFQTFLQHKFLQVADDVDLSEVQEELLDAYVIQPNITDPLQLRDAYIQLSSDFGFVAPTLYELQAMARVPGSSHYLYRFSYRASNRLNKVWEGVTHGDELHFVFGYPFTAGDMCYCFVSNWTDDDRQVSDSVMTMWTNFAKYGDPTPSINVVEEWPAFSADTPTYLDITLTNRLLSNPVTPQITLWTEKIFPTLLGENKPLIG